MLKNEKRTIKTDNVLKVTSKYLLSYLFQYFSYLFLRKFAKTNWFMNKNINVYYLTLKRLMGITFL